MQLRALAVMGAATVLWAASAAAQAKPDFNGKWALDQDKTTAANPAAAGGGGGGGGGRRGGGGGGGGCGQACSITVDAAALTIERDMQGTAVKTVYKLDGTESDVAMGQNTVKAKAKWEGATIVIETTIPGREGGAPTTRKAVYSMEGEWLVIANTAPPRGGGDPVTTKQYFKKG